MLNTVDDIIDGFVRDLDFCENLAKCMYDRRDDQYNKFCEFTEKVVKPKYPYIDFKLEDGEIVGKLYISTVDIGSIRRHLK